LREVLVSAPSRLHLGILDPSGREGRIHGGLGVALLRPRMRIRLSPSRRLEASGPLSGRAEERARAFLRKVGRKGARIEVLEGIPEHTGLGSTTQLSLAVGVGLSRLFGMRMSVEEVSLLLARGEFSGVGTHLFRLGGFVLEGGRRREGELPPLLFRAPFPEEWRFVVALPPFRGLGEEEERRAFRRVSPSPGEVGRACRLVLMKMLPGLVEGDLPSFGSALTELQRVVGGYFREVQGGLFASPLLEETVELLLEEGAEGAGQSSWGPAVYGVVEGEGRARVLEGKVRRFLEKRGGGEVFTSGADNRGARISVR
jgi:beta-RFAP synthase